MALKPFLEKVESIRRGKVYSSVAMVFHKVETAKELSYRVFKTKEIYFFPFYMGRKMAKIRVQNLPIREDPLRVVATVLKPITERVEIIKATVDVSKFWQEQTVNLFVQVESDALSDVSESLLIRDEKLNIFVGGGASVEVFRV